jgi:hypothetical protein
VPATFGNNIDNDKTSLKYITEICNVYDIYIKRIRDCIDMFEGNVFNTGDTDINRRLSNFDRTCDWYAYKFVNPQVMERMRTNDQKTYDLISNFPMRYIEKIMEIIRWFQGCIPENFDNDLYMTYGYDDDDDKEHYPIAKLGLDVIPKHMAAELENVLMSRINSLLKLLTNLGGDYSVLNQKFFDISQHYLERGDGIKDCFVTYLIRLFVLKNVEWQNWKDIVWYLPDVIHRFARCYYEDEWFYQTSSCCNNCRDLHRATQNGFDVTNATPEDKDKYLCKKWYELFEQTKRQLQASNQS